MTLNVSKYANFVVNYCVKVNKGDKTLILGPSESIPLITEIYREAIRAGGLVSRPFITIPNQKYIFHKEAQEFQLEHVDPLDVFAMETIDVLIMIIDKMNTKELASIPPEIIHKKMMSDYKFMSIFFQRQGTGELKWTMIPYPTVSMAQEANMSQDEFSNLIEKSCLLDKPNPAEEWQKVQKEQQVYCDFLKNVDQLRFVSKGTDLSMSVKGRTWVNDHGQNNLPDGEIFTGPIEDSVNGTISFSYPAVDRSHVMEGIVLKFEAGKVIEATAIKGQKTLNSIINIPGGNQIGEIAIGTNYEHTTFVGDIQFDEKLGGTIHLALGNGFPETGSKNQSQIHKDLLCDMKENGQIFADGKLIYEKGKFLI